MALAILNGLDTHGGYDMLLAVDSEVKIFTVVEIGDTAG